MCDVIVYSHEEGCAKPDPRSYAIVCERLGSPRRRDRVSRRRGRQRRRARAVGMTAIRFGDTRQSVGALERALAQARQTKRTAPSASPERPRA